MEQIICDSCARGRTIIAESDTKGDVYVQCRRCKDKQQVGVGATKLTEVVGRYSKLFDDLKAELLME